MSFLTNLLFDRLITRVKTAAEPRGQGRQEAVAKLKKLGAGVIEPTILALTDADENATAALVEVLSALVSNKTFPVFIRGMFQGGPRVVAGIAAALKGSRDYSPGLLLEALSTEGVSRSVLLEIINAQRGRFTTRELLAAAYAQQPNEKAALFRIIAETADASILPDLLARLDGKDADARLHIITMLSNFNHPDVSRALQGQLRDGSKAIRAAALSALAEMDGSVDVQAVANLLRDPALDVQYRAIDVLIRANHPDTVHHLVEVLKDENEYARRAAVEVINEVGDVESVKYLLAALKDSDWWVRSRAGDALGKIGGPKVIDAVLRLVRDPDEEIRRTAIEILNQTKDERAVSHLIEATRDEDWWVSERAVDALAEIGSKRALPHLEEMLHTAPARSLPVVVRAVGRLGNARVFDLLQPFTSRPEKEVRVEALQAIARVVDTGRAEQVRAQLQAQAESADDTIARAAGMALAELQQRLNAGGDLPSGVGAAMSQAALAGSRIDDPSRAQGAEGERPRLPPLDQPAPAIAAALPGRLDIKNLRSGDIVEGRYRFIEPIGKGAFGSVLLMDDTVVNERLILKFLNPHVLEDEEMMKRFVHELRYSRKITHRNVIRIYDFLQLQGIYAISMEYFPSHTLGSEVVDEKPLPLRRAVGFGIDMCAGMAVAHQVGIVHRDLKPANVLINDEGLLKIVDFGVAAAHREGDTQLTRTGYAIGSPRYMAPEQILGQKVDERADIYAIGVILYELVTGVPPYAHGDHMSIMYQHTQGKARPPREVNPQLPPRLGDLVMKAMAVEPANRFQSMDELRAALEAHA